MNSVQVEEISLDAYQIAEEIYTKNSINNNFSFEEMYVKTLFELLLIVLIEGLKIFYSNENKKVDLFSIDSEKIQHINLFLKKIGIEVKLHKYDFLTWNYMLGDRIIKDYRNYNITPTTQLNELNYMNKIDKYYVIKFDYIKNK